MLNVEDGPTCQKLHRYVLHKKIYKRSSKLMLASVKMSNIFKCRVNLKFSTWTFTVF